MKSWKLCGSFLRTGSLLVKVVFSVDALMTQLEVINEFYWPGPWTRCYYTANTRNHFHRHQESSSSFLESMWKLVSEARNSIEYVSFHLMLGMFVMVIVCWHVGWNEWLNGIDLRTNLDFACSGSAEGRQARHIQFRCNQNWIYIWCIAAHVTPRLCHTAGTSDEQLQIGCLLKHYAVWSLWWLLWSRKDSK